MRVCVYVVEYVCMFVCVCLRVCMCVCGCGCASSFVSFVFRLVCMYLYTRVLIWVSAMYCFISRKPSLLVN